MLAAMEKVRRMSPSRTLMWIALILPFSFGAAKSSNQLLAASGGTSTSELVVRGALPLAILAASFAFPVKREGHGLPEIALIGYCGLALASAFWSIDSHATLLKAVSLTCTYLIMLRLVRTYDDTDTALKSLSNLVHGLMAVVVLQFAVIPNEAYAPVDISGHRRLGSLIPQMGYNTTAYVAAAALFATVLGVGPRVLMQNRLTKYMMFVIYLAVLLATFTRLAVALVAIYLLFILASSARRRTVHLSALLLSALAAALALAPHWAAVTDFVLRGQDERAIANLTGRTEIWSLSVQFWREHRFLGGGYYAGHRFGIVSLSQFQSNLDNTWLESLVDVGLLGTMFLALFAVSGFVRLLSWVPSDRQHRVWAILVFSYGALISFVNPTIQTPGPALILMAFPILAALPSRAPVDQQPGRPRAAHV